MVDNNNGQLGKTTDMVSNNHGQLSKNHEYV